MGKNYSKLISSLESATPCDIAVIGDFILDRYLNGTVDRISPEAPIPVLLVRSERNVLGGAGNVVANLCGLGSSVHCFGRLGGDSKGREMTGLLEGLNSGTRGKVCLHMFESGKTISKTRVIGNGRQQMLRFDREEYESLTPSQESELIGELAALADSGLKVVILSDYGKGVCSASLCTGVISFCRSRGIAVFVDPKGSDWSRYKHASLITPNLKELNLAAGTAVSNDDNFGVEKTARGMLKRCAFDALLVTRSEKGCTYVSDETFFTEPSLARDVYDVSGAGDTMISTVAYAYARGILPRDCCRLANLACQVVIGKVGTYPVSLDELKDACSVSTVIRRFSGENKICSAEAAAFLRESWREKGEQVVFTNGCFDVFHAGHVDSLTRARACGDRLIVGLNSDSSVRRLKGESRPLNSQENRAHVLAALECVDAVVIFDEDTPEELLSHLRPDVLAKGGDYTPEQVAGRQYAGRVEILPLVPGLSSTKIIEKARSDV